MTLKIAFIGKICAGKTTASEYIIKQIPEMKKLAFADKLKEIAVDLFDMKDKDRKLLQEIGTAMRNINKDVFMNYLIKESKKYNYVCVEDGRFINEINALKKNGFILVKLNISKKIQLERIKKTYPNTYKVHLKRLEHYSETQMDNIDNKLFDYILNVDEIDNLFKELDFLLQKKYFKNINEK